MSEKDGNVVSTEELFVRQVKKRGTGQVSGGDQEQPAEIVTTEQTSKVSVTIHEEAIKARRAEKIKKIKEAAEKVSPTIQAQKQNSKPKIQRVPSMLQDHKNFNEYFEPRVVAFGPYHHGKPKYEPAEEIKLQLAGDFINDIDQTITGEALLKKVEENIEELKKCYDEEATIAYDDEALAWMLFIDGCSMLEFIYTYRSLYDLNLKRDIVAFIEHDMFLLENQLPYRLLELLMSSSMSLESLKCSIEKFVEMHCATKKTQPTEAPSFGFPIDMEREPTPTHLLDILRTRMVREPVHKLTLLGILRLRYQPIWKLIYRSNSSSKSFYNVQEHLKAGIHFRRSEYPSLTDVYFKSYGYRAFLYLPKIKVDNLMRLQFMNMIAYEMCSGFQNNSEITSYIDFLSSLIDHPDDVKHLRKRGILQNSLGSDEDVVRLFKEIGGMDLVPNNAIYGRVEEQIEKRHNSIWKKLMAFIDENSTSLASISVLLGLVLSGIQTWYAVFSNPSHVMPHAPT